MDFYSRSDVRADDNIREERMPFILSQYAASPRITGILKNFSNEMSPRSGALLFYEKIFDILTAEGIGLDIWGRIVAISRTIADQSSEVSLTLDDEYYRKLLLYKALSNINEATIPALTTLINILYSETGGVVINMEDYTQHTDGNYYNQTPMRIRWVFNYFFTDTDIAVFRVAGTYNRGGGVGWGVYAVDPDQVFGFDGSGMQPFNQGIFDPVGVITT